MFFKLINLLKINFLYKKKKFKKNINKTELKFCKKLIELNIIKYIKHNKKNNFIIYLNYFNGKPLYSNLKNLYRKNKIIYINYKFLKKYTFKNNYILILSTNKGIFTNFDIIKKKIGGLLILKISN